MLTKLHWVNGSWPGKLAIAARPRGGEWLKDEIAAWHEAGIGVVVSLLTPDEEQYLDLRGEPSEVRRQNMEFISLPIEDRQVPASGSVVNETLEKIDAELSSGSGVVIHCRQGIGRSGMLAACLLIMKGLRVSAAVDAVSAARGLPIPETHEQQSWIDRYSEALAGAK